NNNKKNKNSKKRNYNEVEILTKPLIIIGPVICNKKFINYLKTTTLYEEHEIEYNENKKKNKDNNKEKKFKKIAPYCINIKQYGCDMITAICNVFLYMQQMQDKIIQIIVKLSKRFFS